MNIVLIIICEVADSMVLPIIIIIVSIINIIHYECNYYCYSHYNLGLFLRFPFIIMFIQFKSEEFYLKAELLI
jgi:hypothetical protein